MSVLSREMAIVDMNEVDPTVPDLLGAATSAEARLAARDIELQRALHRIAILERSMFDLADRVHQALEISRNYPYPDDPGLPE